MLPLYRILTLLLSPLIVLWLLYRLGKGREDKDRFRERLGVPGLPRPQGSLIWVHAASVGEANSVMPLLQRLHDTHPDSYLMLTTGTVTSARLIASRLPARAFHQYVPADMPWAVARFVSHWKPDLAIWVESELWPNLLISTRRRGVPMALINARMSNRSAHRWQKFHGFFSSLISCFQLVYAGSEEDRRRLQHLDVPDVRMSGNLKYDVAPLAADPTQIAQLSAAIGQRPVWLVSSTHAGEELMAVEVHKALREIFPNLLTIIAPRHPKRGDDIMQQLADHGLNISRRSLLQPIGVDTEIYMADTLGELGIFYRLCSIVFIGGSLVPVGGHNPIEPAQLDCAVICGPHMHNFASITRDMTEELAMLQVKDTDQLTNVLRDWLSDHDAPLRYAQAAKKSVESRRGAVDAMIADLKPIMRTPITTTPEG
jgi:3-deoxy-D-manno-octulosonic-acid transferase